MIFQIRKNKENKHSETFPNFVLINTLSLLEHVVYNSLLELTFIDYVYPLFGEYDLIVKINTNCHQQTDQLIQNEIKKIDGIVDTKTLSCSK